MNGHRARPRFPLFWKLLTPMLVLVLVIGPAAAFLVVRDVAARDRATLEHELLRQLLDAQTRIRDRELRLSEGVRLAANLRGMAEAIQRDDATSATELLRSVVALQPDLASVAVVDRDGALFAVMPDDATSAPSIPRLHRAAAALIVGAQSPTATLVGPPQDADVMVAAPVCAGAVTCDPVGVAATVMPLEQLAIGVRETAQRSDLKLTVHPRRPAPDRPVASYHDVGDQPHATLEGALVLGGQPVGVIRVSLPTDSTATITRATADRIGLVFLGAMIAVVMLAVLLTRSIVGRVSSLVATARAIGAGNLSTRSGVVADDEIGELARTLNAMADEVQDSQETLEARVAQRTAEVERLLKERTEFFASLSHELRTPLAVVLSQARLRQMSGETHDRDAWDIVATSADQLLRTVNAILDLARAGSGRLEIHVTPLDLGALLTEIADAMVGHAAAGGVELRVEAPATTVTASADGERLRQIAVNLLDNAIKYTPPGGCVTVGCRRVDASWSEMTVTDTGVGIPAEAGDRIFEPFHRVAGARTQRGEDATGLGLALARTLAEAQGGALTYVSREGLGSTFAVRLPTETAVSEAPSDGPESVQHRSPRP